MEKHVGFQYFKRKPCVYQTETLAGCHMIRFKCPGSCYAKLQRWSLLALQLESSWLTKDMFSVSGNFSWLIHQVPDYIAIHSLLLTIHTFWSVKSLAHLLAKVRITREITTF